jgi:hypothetical protein
MQSLLDSNTVLPPHTAQPYMTPAFPAACQQVATDAEWKMVAVYVDDYILAAVQNASGDLIQRVGRAALHTIHAIFPPPAISGHEGGKDRYPRKKLEGQRRLFLVLYSTVQPAQSDCRTVRQLTSQ